MSDTVPGPGAPAGQAPPAGAGASPRDSAAVILQGLGERREGARVEVQLPCTVFIGSHVHDGTLRDVSTGGAMVHGVRGLLAGDLVRLRLARLTDHVFVAEVRGVSLLGVHLAIRAGADQALWHEAIRGLLPQEPPEAMR
ncbi:PilZ domain-containing protein [Roseomonas rosulenta]|uniref:PilZ domain-containing protein n=1 Tax=Roseomonas rosulenta TaxID=2748667 RepID=UPI0018DF7FA2|nr:PilZ domain-containing protein [Roseomonas rosulenta]